MHQRGFSSRQWRGEAVVISSRSKCGEREVDGARKHLVVGSSKVNSHSLAFADFLSVVAAPSQVKLLAIDDTGSIRASALSIPLPFTFHLHLHILSPSWERHRLPGLCIRESQHSGSYTLNPHSSVFSLRCAWCRPP